MRAGWVGKQPQMRFAKHGSIHLYGTMAYVRLSVGIESADDLIAELKEALS